MADRTKGTPNLESNARGVQVETRTFYGSRLARGNRIRRSWIRVTPSHVVCSVRQGIGRHEVSLRLKRIMRIELHVGIIWTSARVVEWGRGNVIDIHGLSRDTAYALRKLIDDRETGFFAGPRKPKA